MNAPPDKKHTRDFSDWALLRGALGAALCAYLMIMILYPSLIGFRGIGGLLDLNGLLDSLNGAFQPVSLIFGMIWMSACAFTALLFLASSRHDHTTYRSAAWAGAKTAGLFFFAIYLITLVPSQVIQLISSPKSILSPSHLDGVLTFLWFVMVLISTGAVSGLFFRLVAGAPTIELKPEA